MCQTLATTILSGSSGPPVVTNRCLPDWEAVKEFSVFSWQIATTFAIVQLKYLLTIALTHYTRYYQGLFCDN